MLIIERQLSPAQSRKINDLSARRVFGEAQGVARSVLRVLVAPGSRALSVAQTPTDLAKTWSRLKHGFKRASSSRQILENPPRAPPG
jgi:hypothetical protein